jgi:hypothetical protein
MIDFIKIQITCPNYLQLLKTLNAHEWAIKGNYDRSSGEIKSFPLEAYNQGLYIKFKSEKFIELSGSLHTYLKGENYSDFHFHEFVQTVNKLCDTAGLDPFICKIHHLEFGVNINPPFNSKDFLFKVLNYRGTNFNPMLKQSNASLGILCQRSQINIKLYCKKTQYNLDKEIMRIELKVFKMQYLKGIVVFLSDLLKKSVWLDLSKRLIQMFEELIILDYSTLASGLTKTNSELLKNWSNPKYLEKLNKEDTKRFEYERRKFREICKNDSSRRPQQIITELINAKANQLSQYSDGDFTNFTNFPNGFKKDEFHLFYPLKKKEEKKAKASAIESELPEFKLSKIGENEVGKIGENKVGKKGKKPTKNNNALKLGLLLIETSFLGKNGKFYIPNPIDPNRVAVYESIEAYDNQLQIPTYIDKEEAEKLFLKKLPIDLSTLQTVNVSLDR